VAPKLQILEDEGARFPCGAASRDQERKKAELEKGVQRPRAMATNGCVSFFNLFCFSIYVLAL
jgi:hypothetical protein